MSRNSGVYSKDDGIALCSATSNENVYRSSNEQFTPLDQLVRADLLLANSEEKFQQRMIAARLRTTRRSGTTAPSTKPPKNEEALCLDLGNQDGLQRSYGNAGVFPNPPGFSSLHGAHTGRAGS
jgi:hypothetical protein